MVNEVRVLEVLARGVVGGLLVVGPLLALAPAASASTASASTASTSTTVAVPVVVPVAGPRVEGPDPFKHWDTPADEPDRQVQEIGNSGPALAKTGFDAPATATLGLLAVATGLALIRLSRRRGIAPAR